MSTSASDQVIGAKIGFGEKLAYGAGDLASNFIFTTVNTFLLIFYTDVFGIAPAVAGVILLGARLWDAINDPIMGMIVDRTTTRWGKFRPYLLFGAAPFAILGILTFTVPTRLGETGRIVYAVLTYVGLGMVYTAVNTPYGALTSSMTQDPRERTSISAVRMFMALLGAFLVSTLLPILVPILGGDSPARGYRLTMVIFGVTAAVLFVVTFCGVTERIAAPRSQKKVTIGDFFKVVRNNDQLLILCVVFLVLFASNSIVSAVGLFFFTYVLGDAQLFSVYSLANFVPLVLGIPIMTYVASKIGKKQALIWGLLISLLGPLGVALFTHNFQLLVITRVVASIGGAATVAIIWGLVPDTIEYGEWKTGIRAEGATYSIVGFFFKLGVTFGGLVPGLVLERAGYVANQGQVQSSIDAIVALYSVVPIVIGLVGVALTLLYKLDEKTYRSILQALAERRV